MDVDALFEKLDRWANEEKILASTARYLKKWLGSAQYADFHDEILGLIEAEDFQQLNDCFYTQIPFGTGGRRGTEGVGPNRINIRTIGESAQGLAAYVLSQGREFAARGVVVAHDVRRHSVQYARQTARILAGNGVKVFLFDGFRSTPELSFAVRHLDAAAGVVITASHNPPPDNGFKAYWEDGGQVVPPHDARIIEEVNRVEEIGQIDLDSARASGLLIDIGAEVDEAYFDLVCGLSLSEERDLAAVYTPLHGTGITCVAPVLQRMGFTGLEVLEEQATADGNFPNVSGGKPNPENTEAMENSVNRADEIGAELVLASDPDADRLGVAVRTKSGNWTYLTGNQVGALLVDYTLSRLSDRGELPPVGYVIKTLVSTDLVARIADSYGVETVGDLLVGFKYIAEVMRTAPEEKTFLFGFEESLGYLRAGFVRDKDAVQAAIYVCETAARLKAEGKTLLDRLDDLYQKHGYFSELGHSVFFEGAQGHGKMEAIMDGLRSDPPTEVAGHPVMEIVDRKEGTRTRPGTGEREEVSGHRGNVLVFVLSEDSETRVTVRPSGTEPKIKHYIATSGRIDDGFGSLASLKRLVDSKASDLLDGFMEIEQAFLK